MKQEYTFEEILVLLERARMDDVSQRLRELWAEMVTDKARLLMERDSLRTQLAEVEADAKRYLFIRNGGAYIEPTEYAEDGIIVKDMYMATDTGKYYADLRDFDMDLDAAMKEQP